MQNKRREVPGELHILQSIKILELEYTRKVKSLQIPIIAPEKYQK